MPDPNNPNGQNELIPCYLSWGYIEDAVLDLAAQLKPSLDQYCAVIAIARGGLVPATLLYHALDIKLPLITTHISSYDGNDRRSRLNILSPLQTLNVMRFTIENSRFLIVDDIVDSGETIKYIKRRLSPARCDILSIICRDNKEARLQSDLHYAIAPSNEWIVFPWESRLPSKNNE